MKLRQKSKRDQAIDAAASVAKTWSEWRLGEKVSKTATKASKKAAKSAAKAKKSSKSSKPARRKPMKVVGVIALVGGVGAAVAKKLGGGKAEPLYTPPGPAPDMADLANETSSSPQDTSVPSTDEPATTASTDTPARDPSPVVVGDLAGDDAARAESDGIEAGGSPDELGSDEAPPIGEAAPSQDLAPDPETLVSDTAADPAPGDADESTERPL